MNKNIENITEELMMNYVEGNLDSAESEKFEKILSQNDYLNRRVSILKSMTDNNPIESPSKRVHNQVLSNLNIDNDSNILFIKKYIDSFMHIFEQRPLVSGSVILVFCIIHLWAFWYTYQTHNFIYPSGIYTYRYDGLFRACKHLCKTGKNF